VKIYFNETTSIKNMNRPIVFLTDFGLKDHYAGILKGVALSVHPGAVLIDLCHEIEPQNVIQAATLLEISYRYFPKGSIFVCVVDPGVGTARKILCVRTRDYLFLAPDNGLLAPVLKKIGYYEVREVENKKYFLGGASNTFHGRDILMPVAAHLARKNIFRFLGKILKTVKPLSIPPIRKGRLMIEGEILYFDRFGNAFTNLRQTDAAAGFWNKARIKAGSLDLGGLRKTYGDGSRSLCALFSSFGQLELALPNGNAQIVYKLCAGQKVSATL